MRPTTTWVNGGAADTHSSTSSPAIVSVSQSLAVSTGGSAIVRNQCSENLMGTNRLTAPGTLRRGSVLVI